MTLAFPKNRRGRKRKFKQRLPCGRIVSVPEDPRLVVMNQPHRRGLPIGQAEDMRLENIFDNLHFIGAITSNELGTGRWYRRVVAEWRAVMAVADPARMPTASSGGDIPPEEAKDRVKLYNAARKALESGGAATVSIVDNLILLNQPLPERGFKVLVAGLRKLAELREKQAVNSETTA